MRIALVVLLQTAFVDNGLSGGIHKASVALITPFLSEARRECKN
jgi:hypothetical protein